jgi:hypothetical protein
MSAQLYYAQRAGSAETGDLLVDRSPRAPHAAVAYPRGRPGWRDPGGLLQRVVLLLALAAALAWLAGGRPSSSPVPPGGSVAQHLAGGARLARGPPRTVLVLDCGSSGSRM